MEYPTQKQSSSIACPILSAIESDRTPLKQLQIYPQDYRDIPLNCYRIQNSWKIQFIDKCTPQNGTPLWIYGFVNTKNLKSNRFLMTFDGKNLDKEAHSNDLLTNLTCLNPQTTF